MPTLYVENVPEELYKALQGRARKRHRSISDEVLSLLEENIPTEKELKARWAFLHKLEQMREKAGNSHRRFPSTKEMQREDSAR